VTQHHAANEPLELSPEELQRITSRRQHAAQARVLAHLGIPHHRHPIDGHVIVGRDAARAALSKATDAPGEGREEASDGINGQKKA